MADYLSTGVAKIIGIGREVTGKGLALVPGRVQSALVQDLAGSASASIFVIGPRALGLQMFDIIAHILILRRDIE